MVPQSWLSASPVLSTSCASCHLKFSQQLCEVGIIIIIPILHMTKLRPCPDRLHNLKDPRAPKLWNHNSNAGSLMPAATQPRPTPPSSLL